MSTLAVIIVIRSRGGGGGAGKGREFLKRKLPEGDRDIKQEDRRKISRCERTRERERERENEKKQLLGRR